MAEFGTLSSGDFVGFVCGGSSRQNLGNATAQNCGTSSEPSLQISSGAPSNQDQIVVPGAHPLRSTSRVVQVSVGVHDKKGNPIPDRTKCLHDFTSDTASLLAALLRYEGQMTPELAASVPQRLDTGRPEMDAFLNNAFRGEANFVVSDRVRRTVMALKDIANHVDVLQGRKNLVWVPGGFPFGVGNGSLERHDDQKLVLAKDVESAAQAYSWAGSTLVPDND